MGPEVLWANVSLGATSQPNAASAFLSYFPGALQQGSRIDALQMVLAVASIALAATGRKGARGALRIKATFIIVIAVVLLVLKAFQSM